MSKNEALVRPGIIGRCLRATLGVLVLGLVSDLLNPNGPITTGRLDLTDGQTIGMLALVVWTGGYVVTELTLRGSWPAVTGVVALGAVAASIIPSTAGTLDSIPLASAHLGTYLQAWALIVFLLLGPAFLLAAILGTPGCEMRSYADLVARLRGKDPTTVACPGWIDRLDAVRIGGY